MLVFQSTDPQSLAENSPWPDARFVMPVERVWAIAEAQRHRRFFKSHLSLDLLPLFQEVKYIHVTRDGRDAAMSLYNHRLNLSADALALRDKVSLSDPKFGDPYPRISGSPAEFFRRWVREDPAGNANELSYFHMENSFWAERTRENILLIHYNDLKSSLPNEIARIADFLGIGLPGSLGPKIVEAAGFEAMKRDRGSLLPPSSSAAWGVDSDQFLFKGTNGRWQDAIMPDDNAFYEDRAKMEFPAKLAQWVAHGRTIITEPREA